MMDEELSRLAEEALLREARRGAQLAQVCGPSGWRKCKLPSTNKIFLRNTLLGAMAANRVKERQEKLRKDQEKRRKLVEEKKAKKGIWFSTVKNKNKKPESPPQKPHPPEDATTERRRRRSRTRDDAGDGKKGSSSGPVFMWTDAGLELTNQGSKASDSGRQKAAAAAERRSDPDKRRRRSGGSSVAPRKIRFVPASKEGTSDKG